MNAPTLYEQLYCARGDMENRIKEQQLFLFADRTSSGKMKRISYASIFRQQPMMLMHALRRLGLKAHRWQPPNAIPFA